MNILYLKLNKYTFPADYKKTKPLTREKNRQSDENGTADPEDACVFRAYVFVVAGMRSGRSRIPATYRKRGDVTSMAAPREGKEGGGGREGT